MNFLKNVYIFTCNFTFKVFPTCMYGHTSISTQALQHKSDQLAACEFMCMVTPIGGVSSILRNLKKENATCFVHCVYVGGGGSLICFGIENTEDMKNFGDYWKFQSLKVHSAYLNILKNEYGYWTMINHNLLKLSNLRK